MAILQKLSLQRIRSATRTFKKRTAISIDHWSFTEMADLPDSALSKFGLLLAVIKGTSVPPMQCFLNLMATFPKNTGGTETVAIAAILYRFLTDLEDESLVAYEKDNAFENDSAQQGISAIVSSEDRAFHAKPSKSHDTAAYSMLWDISKLFNSLDMDILFTKQPKQFPMRQPAPFALRPCPPPTPPQALQQVLVWAKTG